MIIDRMEQFGLFAIIMLFINGSCTLARNIRYKPTPPNYPFPFAPRSEWLAEPATTITLQQPPAPNVVIHHSYQPAACHDRESCSEAMRSMQKMHQVENGWADIGYNFAVGSDGAVYEGRGWGVVGAHASGHNVGSVGIVLIGDWVENRPPPNQLQATKDLIAAGVRLGFIEPDYTLFGHRQLGNTECPGEALFQEIEDWQGIYESNETENII